MRSILAPPRHASLPTLIRFLAVPRDLPSVLDTESATPDQWNETDFGKFHFSDHSHVRVAELSERNYVCGHCVLSYASWVTVQRLVVKPGFRTQGVGRALLNDALTFARNRRKKLVIPVRERDLSAQIWLRNLGIRCATIVDDWCHGEDPWYVFEVDKP